MLKTKDLFTPLELGDYTLRNRIVMGPMTRGRASDDGSPGELMAIYYRQRASAGLIISEGIYPSPMGKGYVRTPGMCTMEQVAAWKKVTAAVHAEGGCIFAQIMHAGRISHPSFLPGNAVPVAPSAVRPHGESYTSSGMQPYVTPRALETSEIPGVIEEHRVAAARAIEAGFDGVELHAASGYLPMQFLSSGTNLRMDRYGGSAANRARFVIETLEAMAQAAGANRVGIKISPEIVFNDIRDANPRETYVTLVKAISGMGLAYLHVGVSRSGVDYHGLLRPLFRGPYLAGGGLDEARARELIATGRADVAVFGTAFVANPDLPARLRRRAKLNVPDEATFYTSDAKGYIDYPTLEGAL